MIMNLPRIDRSKIEVADLVLDTGMKLYLKNTFFIIFLYEINFFNFFIYFCVVDEHDLVQVIVYF